jgi:thiol-disulfide isomerase/thioredoxin
MGRTALTQRTPLTRLVGAVVTSAVAVAVSTGLGGCAAASVQRSASASQGASQLGLTQYPQSQRPAAPAISGTTLTGGKFALTSTLGNVVVLNVWASWCGPCRSESPDLARVSASFSHEPVRFIGVDEQDDSRSARKFAASTGATYPNVIDTAGQLLSRLRLLPRAGVPSTLILDRHGRVADRVIGPVTAAEITSAVRALLIES